MTCDFCKSDSNTMPSCPLKPHSQHHISWHRWRAINDKIINSPNYHYGAPGSRLLIKLAQFAHTQMAIFNTRQWSTYTNYPDFTGQFDGHFDRAKDRKALTVR